MKKKIIVLLSFILLYIIPKPEYKELNNLAIIKEIQVKCIKDGYQIELQEILPKKENSNIIFQYKSYRIKQKEIKNIKTSLEKKYQKKFYYNGIQKISTNCEDEIDLLLFFKKNKISK
ncbi:MAG: hypothetical protein IJI60_02935 [Bacilli bacterium]|nr:hypothetical protein [Bacilli bacterium]